MLEVIIKICDVRVHCDLQQRTNCFQCILSFCSSWFKGVNGVRISHRPKAHLVFPLKLCPHLSEFRIGAGSGLDVVHDVDVDVTEDDTVSVACSS